MATRQPSRPPRWYWLFLIVFSVFMLLPVWGAIRLVQEGSFVLGIGLGAVVCVGGALWLRAVRGEMGRPWGDDDPAPLLTSNAYLDYLIWISVGLPFIFAGTLLLWLLTGGSNPR